MRNQNIKKIIGSLFTRLFPYIGFPDKFRRVLISVIMLFSAITLVACSNEMLKTATGNAVSSETEPNDQAYGIFQVDNLDATDIDDNFLLEDLYIENRVSVMNRYFIDENHILWGYGYNNYGQLGIGTIDSLDTFYTYPIQIAENVVSVDASCNGYFCIYLTEDNNLYGMGSNMLGLLGQEYDTTTVFSVEEYNKIPSPVLLMRNVAYARAGREAIVALDNEGTVWWWGQYKTTYTTYHYDDTSLNWETQANEKNPTKMLANHPQKILDNCIYVTTGDTTGAAIGQDGSLYTWGLNIFGECGVEVTSDDFLRTPKKVLDNVRMVWPEKIYFDSYEEDIPDSASYRTTYPFNIFALLNDKTVVAAGKNLGNLEKTIAVTGDLIQTTSHIYSDTFLPVTLEEYDAEKDAQKLNGLSWGIQPEEAEEFLTQEGLRYEHTTRVHSDSIEMISIEDGSYNLYFDDENQLFRILMQNGNSRNPSFTKGMSLEDIKEQLDCNLIAVTRSDIYTITYWTEAPVNGSYLGFCFNDEALYQVWETVDKESGFF